jgi:Rieske Fe-S protein
MLNRRVFLKAISFLALFSSYPSRDARGQGEERDRVTLSLERLKAPWDSVSFSFSSETIPGLAVRLPGGKLIVVSRVCPHQRCFTDLIRDPAQVFRETTYEPPGPVLVCPCHSSVFDLLDDGKVLFGPAPKPPDRFKFEIQGDKIIIAGLD